MQPARPSNTVLSPPKRSFIKKSLYGLAGLGLLTAGYSYFETGWYRITQERITIPGLPKSFSGKRVAFLSDLHLGSYTGPEYLRTVIQAVMAEKPDLILLGGDYVAGGAQYFSPVFEILSALKAPLGVFGIMGNHDHWNGITQARDGMKQAGIHELTNTGIWLESGGERLRIAGVGDLWCDQQNLDQALADVKSNESALLLSHNPDFVEGLCDKRIGMVFSGHTHGGQVVLPVVDSPWIPSRYGNKYDYGLKTYGQQAPVFISKGLGAVQYPFRLGCRPEAHLITLL